MCVCVCVCKYMYIYIYVYIYIYMSGGVCKHTHTFFYGLSSALVVAGTNVR